MKQRKSKSVTVGTITVKITKKKMKNLRICILPPDGRMCVSAPIGVSDEEIARMIGKNIKWIEKQREKIIAAPVTAALQLTQGETLLLWGEEIRLHLVYGNKAAVVLDGRELTVTLRKEDAPERCAALVRAFYREQLERTAAEGIAKWESATALRCAEWRIKYMTSRWGSCNAAARRIWLSLLLAQKPKECLEYVILHELAHLRVQNHGKEFKAILDEFLPEWRALRRRLNETPLRYLP